MLELHHAVISRSLMFNAVFKTAIQYSIMMIIIIINGLQERVVKLMGEMDQSKARYNQQQNESKNRKKQILDNKLKAK